MEAILGKKDTFLERWGELEAAWEMEKESISKEWGRTNSQL